MNEWGIPDWPEPQSYGETSKWGVMRWRWEFYRRRDDLREFFDAHAEATFRRHCEAYGAMPDGSGATFPDGTTGRVLRPDEPGFRADCFWVDAQRFGYSGIPNPRISDQTGSAIFAVLDYPGCTTSLYLGKGEPWPAKPKLEVSVCEGQAAVVFDLSQPIGPQLDGAKAMLEWWQSEKQYGVKPRRKQKSKWLGYLRALDAKSAGASWADIASIFPDTAGTPQTGRDKWQQADALRNNFGLSFTISE
jgi:hypothetical protein